MTPKTFPILLSYPYPDVPRSIPWALVEPFRRRVWDFHGQTLEELAARGGLSMTELYLHAHCRTGRGREWMQGLATVNAQTVGHWFSEWVLTAPDPSDKVET